MNTNSKAKKGAIKLENETLYANLKFQDMDQLSIAGDTRNVIVTDTLASNDYHNPTNNEVVGQRKHSTAANADNINNNDSRFDKRQTDVKTFVQ